MKSSSSILLFLVGCALGATTALAAELELAPRKCTGACPHIYMPVCDTSDAKYANSCEFTLAQCNNHTLQVGKCSAKAPIASTTA